MAVSLVTHSVRRGGVIWLFLIRCNALLSLSSTDAASLRARSAAPAGSLRDTHQLRDPGQTWRARAVPGASQLHSSAKHRRVRPQPCVTAPSRGGSDRSACDTVLVRRERPNLRPPPRFTISRDTGQSDPIRGHVPPAAPGQPRSRRRVLHPERCWRDIAHFSLANILLPTARAQLLLCSGQGQGEAQLLQQLAHHTSARRAPPGTPRIGLRQWLCCPISLMSWAIKCFTLSVYQISGGNPHL